MQNLDFFNEIFHTFILTDISTVKLNFVIPNQAETVRKEEA